MKRLRAYAVVAMVSLAFVLIALPARANNLEAGGMVITYLPEANTLVVNAIEGTSLLGKTYRFDTSQLSKEDLKKIAKPGYGVSIRFHRQSGRDVANEVKADSNE